MRSQRIPQSACRFVKKPAKLLRLAGFFLPKTKGISLPLTNGSVGVAVGVSVRSAQITRLVKWIAELRIGAVDHESLLKIAGKEKPPTAKSGRGLGSD